MPEVWLTHNLTRMVPSELEQLKHALGTEAAKREFVFALAAFLVNLRDPREVDLDDVYRLVLQLNGIDFWAAVPAEGFLALYGAAMDRAVRDEVETTAVPRPSADLVDRISRSPSGKSSLSKIGHQIAEVLRERGRVEASHIAVIVAGTPIVLTWEEQSQGPEAQPA